MLRHRSIAATCTVVAMVVVFQIWSYREGSKKLQIDMGEELAPQVVVELAFAPETFHIQRLQAIGAIQRVEHHRVFLKRVAVKDLERLSRNYWIVSITQPDGTAQ